MQKCFHQFFYDSMVHKLYGTEKKIIYWKIKGVSAFELGIFF